MKFSASDILIIREVVSWYRRNKNRLNNQSKNRPNRVINPGNPALTIQSPSGGIPAATNYVFGSVSCDILISDGSEWKDSGNTETIYNPSPEIELTEGLRLGWAVWDGSKYVLISKLCGDDRTFTAPGSIDAPGP